VVGAESESQLSEYADLRTGGLGRNIEDSVDGKSEAKAELVVDESLECLGFYRTNLVSEAQSHLLSKMIVPILTMTKRRAGMV